MQQWITYRDAETYRSIVRKGPLFPLNSLMYHGIVSAENAYYGLEKVQTDSDFADQVWSYFATGTQLQELYITVHAEQGEVGYAGEGCKMVEGKCQRAG